MKKILLLITVFTLIAIQQNFGQDIKFGKASKQELEEKYYPQDSSANAVILYKKRRTYYTYNDSQGWALVTKFHERIKIYNKDGYDWATKKIKLYEDGDHESVTIKAYTYNLVGNKIEKTKLKNNEIFDEKINKYWNRKKFTMPNLSTGSVVEWEYSIRSPYYWRIDDMVFQYEIPVKYINTEVIVPEFYVFKNQSQGYFPLNIKKNKKTSSITLTNKERSSSGGFAGVKTTISQQKVDYTSNIISCEVNNVPAIKKEPYINNINNYRTLLKFEITAFRPKYGVPKFYNTTWEDVTKTIYKSSNFGEQLAKTSYFKDDLATLINKTDPLYEKVGKIFQFVKNKIIWNEINGKYTFNGVKKAYKEGVGNVADINLTLIAIMRKVGINANPVLISTRSHGISLFPTSDGFNYVIAAVETQNGVILLDATEKYSVPNVLPLRDLNWQGRIIRKDGSSTSINLFPKKHTKKTIFINANLDDEGNLTGIERESFNNLKALKYRSEYNNVLEEDIMTIFEKDNDDIEINQLKVSNKNDIAKPLVYQFDFESDNQVEIIGDKLYFSPLLFLTEKENPFKLEDRKFPVDFGAPWEDKYSISIRLPEGYTIESKPENVAYALPENLGSFKYMINVKDNKLQVLATIRINSPIISPMYYNALKEFYKKMIDKQLEKVVLVKK